MKFLFGLALGVAAGMLFAPASGEETRQNLADKARDVAENQEQKLRQKAGDVGARVGRQAAEAAVNAVGKRVIPEA